MSNQDIAFITVVGLCVIAMAYLWKAWRDLDEYRRRAIHAEQQLRLIKRVHKRADARDQAEIRALEDKLREVQS